MKFTFDKQKNIVVATIVGLVDIIKIVEYINNAVAYGEKHNSYSILFNMQKAEETFSFMDEYDLNKNLTRKTNLTNTHRCAVIYSYNKKKNKIEFKETVAFNWGQGIFKMFCDIDEGLEWLNK